MAAAAAMTANESIGPGLVISGDERAAGGVGLAVFRRDVGKRELADQFLRGRSGELTGKGIAARQARRECSREGRTSARVDCVGESQRRKIDRGVDVVDRADRA